MGLEEKEKDFPMLLKTMNGKPFIYFDSAATSQKPQAVIDSITDYYQNYCGTVHRAVYQYATRATEAYQNVREKVAMFIHAFTSDEIIFTKGTTESINLVAYSYGRSFVHAGDEIIISEIEHHSNIIPWQLLCESQKAVLKVIPVNDKGEILLDKFREMVTLKTKIVSIGHISNALGTIHPIKDIIKIAHEVGAVVFIDGAQAAPHMAIDVQDLDVDFYAFSGHKMYGPTGIGILYGKAELLEKMPPFLGGGDMIDQVTFEKTTYAKPPLKFEAGTPQIAEVIALGAAIDYLNEVGIENIQIWEHELLQYATEKMEKIPGLKIIGTAEKKGAIISFIVDGVHSLDLGTMLDLKGVAVRTGHHCAQPAMRRFGIAGTARVSFGLYNSKAEIDQFVVHLNEVIKKLRQ
jgi:cysteine desulfurase/selenocysteine lyase